MLHVLQVLQTLTLLALLPLCVPLQNLPPTEARDAPQVLGQ
jgi:hypothetical protein